VNSVAVAATHFASLSVVVFTTMEHLASTSGIMVFASEIGGAAFTLASAVGSSVVV
jgi:hypothetical protein